MTIMKDFVVSTHHVSVSRRRPVCVCVFAYVYMAGMRSESLQVSTN